MCGEERGVIGFSILSCRVIGWILLREETMKKLTREEYRVVQLKRAACAGARVRGCGRRVGVKVVDSGVGGAGVGLVSLREVPLAELPVGELAVKLGWVKGDV